MIIFLEAEKAIFEFICILTTPSPALETLAGGRILTQLWLQFLLVTDGALQHCSVRLYIPLLHTSPAVPRHAVVRPVPALPALPAAVVPLQQRAEPGRVRVRVEPRPAGPQHRPLPGEPRQRRPGQGGGRPQLVLTFLTGPLERQSGGLRRELL